MKKIMLFGPRLDISSKNSYGGGTGGYTRNMAVYLKYFGNEIFDIMPCFHTIDGQINLSVFTKPYRLLVDVVVFFRVLISKRIDAVHVLAQYRGAVLREFAIVMLSCLFNKPVMYEIKAGAFIAAYNSKGSFYRRIINAIIKRSKVLLVEGKVYQDYIKEKYEIEAYYFPNVVPSEEIPANVLPKTVNGVLKVLFVGYAYEGKGVLELINACELFASKGHKICLTIVGQVHPDINKVLDENEFSTNFEVVKKGKLHHSKVLKEFEKNDIYCYPSKHAGEGHNNTINEALMYGMIIISSTNGFLSDFLSDENSYPLRSITPEEIERRFQDIINNPDKAMNKSKSGMRLISESFNTDVANEKLCQYYNQLCGI